MNLKLMQELDKQYLKTPFYGTRKMTQHLQWLGYEVNRKRVSRLMKLMGLLYNEAKEVHRHIW